MIRSLLLIIPVLISLMACGQEVKKPIVNYKEVIVIDTLFVFDAETGEDAIEFDTLKLNLKDGLFKDFHSNGKVKEEGMYKAFYGYEKKIGVWKYYNDKGELIKEENYN